MENKYGRVFENQNEYKEYIKSLNPFEVNIEQDFQASQPYGVDVDFMYEYCGKAVKHIQTNWSDSFDTNP